jgi:hypothetical protein
MELEVLMNESVDHLEKGFYGQKFYFSYSSLNKLLWSPQVFYQMYVLGMKEERVDAHLVQGKVIHCLLLEEEKFNDQFMISPSTLPSGNLRTVVDRVYSHYTGNKSTYDDLGVDKLAQFTDEILDVMKEMNYHQSLKTDDQRLDKILTPEAVNYWEFLQKKAGKTLIDQETYEFCRSAVEIVRQNKALCHLIGCYTTEFDNREVLNELPLQGELTSYPFGLKGILDNVVVDHDHKTIFINDIKTTQKDLKDFAETIEYYSYWMQAVVYCTLTGIHFKPLIEKGYQMRFHFVVIDRTFQTYAFPVREQTLVNWLERLEGVLKAADWHYTNRSYELPYEFATGSVMI